MAAGLERTQDGRLETVGVLVFVDQDVVKATANLIGQLRIVHCLRPGEQKVVIIEDVLTLLGLDISSEQFFQLRRPSGAPRERCSHDLLDRRLGIDAP